LRNHQKTLADGGATLTTGLLVLGFTEARGGGRGSPTVAHYQG
jgi:hypothetical protein